MNVWLVGVDHSIQVLQPWSGQSHQKFMDYLLSQIALVSPEILAEEFSEEALWKNANAVGATVEQVALRASLPHMYCDPESRERALRSITTSDEREYIWIERLLNSECHRILFVCGKEHLDSFERKLLSRSWHVTRLKSDWVDF